MSLLTKEISRNGEGKGILTMNPVNITSWLLSWIQRKMVEIGRQKIGRQKHRVAAAWQLMSSQFNHRMGSWGS